MTATKYISVVNNDIYFLACVNNKIVINNSYIGVLILDSELNVIDTIEIIDDLVIYSYYVYQNNILLYCPENSIIVLLDVETGKHMIISLSGFEDEIFGEIYEWIDDSIVLSTYKGNFICINLTNTASEPLYYNECEMQVQKDYDFLKKYTVHKVFSDETKAIVGNNKLHLLDYRSHRVLLEKIEQEQYHDYELAGQCLVKIGENKIGITNCREEFVLKPKKGYIYLRAKFLNENSKRYIITLSSDNKNIENSIIEKYPIVY